MTDKDPFARLDANTNEPDEVLRELAEYFRSAGKPHELFEALKLQTRQRLGLPLVPSEGETAPPEEVDRQLEHGLLAACREVGEMLLRQGRIQEGWMYLRPLGDHARAAELLAQTEPDDDNADQLVQVLVHEGVDVGRGYRIVLDRQGTCNSITLFEQAIAGRGKADQQAAAALLLDHVYRELTANVRADIERREGSPPPDEQSLEELLKGRRQLFADGGYHLDTTHLASTVRFARVLEGADQHARAWELTQYGRNLHPQFQYPGDEPFKDFYPAHALFFSALLGRGVDTALAYFERKAREVDVVEQGTAAIETYVDLLDRLGQTGQALAAAIDLIPDDIPPARVTPVLLELSDRAGEYDTMRAYCRKRGDLLGYAAATVKANH